MSDENLAPGAADSAPDASGADCTPDASGADSAPDGNAGSGENGGAQEGGGGGPAPGCAWRHGAALVRFYEIDLSRAAVDGARARMAGVGAEDAEGMKGLVLYFHPGLNELGGPVVWGDPDPDKPRREYLPFPIAIEGMEYDGMGRLPRPTLTVSNLSAGDAGAGPLSPLRGVAGPNLGALVRALGDLNGCTLTHRMTLARFLDAENFADGNPDADIMLEFPRDTYIFERKAEETSEYIKFELASAMDLEGQLLPGRTYNANYCPHRYRGPLCNYAGAECFGEGDEKVSSRAEDKCGKRLKSCELRHGAGNVLPFGGFPGVGLVAR